MEPTEIVIHIPARAPGARRLNKMAGYTTRGKFRLRRILRRLRKDLQPFVRAKVTETTVGDIIAATERSLGQHRMLVLAGHVPARRR